MRSTALPEQFGEAWRVAAEGQPPSAKRCSCPKPLIERVNDEGWCVTCGRELSIRLPAGTDATAARLQPSVQHEPRGASPDGLFLLHTSAHGDTAHLQSSRRSPMMMSEDAKFALGY